MKSRPSSFIAAAALGTALLIGCGGTPKESAAPARAGAARETVTLTAKSRADIGLTLVTVRSRPMNGSFTAPARVLPNQDLEAHIGSLVQGRVHQVFVNVGDRVTAGQVLMTVEGLDVGTIKAGFVKARAAHDYTKASFERQKNLFEQKIGSQKAVQESKAEFEKALAEYKAEDKKIHSVGLTDEDVLSETLGDDHTSGTLPIKSHIAGVVVERNVVTGQFIDGATTAFKVINSRLVWIDAQIYEKDIARIDRKTDVVFTTAAYPREEFRGRIIFLGQTVDEQSRTITVRGEFANAQGRLLPHMFGEVRIPLGAGAEGIMIPDEAVVQETGHQYVFVQTNDSTFEKRPVTIGASSGAMVEITKGLSAGEAVVSKGVFYLKSDLKKDEATGEEH